MDWNETNWNKEIHYFIKKLIALRKEQTVLATGKIKLSCFSDRVLIIKRYDKTKNIEVILNFGFQPETVNGKIVEPMDYKLYIY